MTTQRLNTRLDGNDYRRVVDHCERTNEAVSEFVRRAVLNQLRRDTERLVNHAAEKQANPVPVNEVPSGPLPADYFTRGFIRPRGAP